MKKFILLSIAIIITLSGCSQSQSKVKDVKTISSISSDDEIYIMCGKIETNEKVDVSSKILGRISKITVDVGSKVKEGDPIIYLNTDDLKSQVDQAEAGVNTAKANADKAKQGSRPEQIASAKATLESANQNYDTAEKNYDRQQKLVKSGSTPEVNVEQAQQTLSTAKSQYETAEQNLTMLEKGPTQADINAADASVKQAQTSVDTANTALKNGIITSPISGTVSVKNTNTGEIASPGSELVSIVNSDVLYVNAYMPSRFLADIKQGQTVDIKVPDIKNKLFHGEVSVIDSSISNQSDNVLVKVTLKDTDTALKTGMFAEIGYKK